ncbi:unnamed protein product [Diplocarpon coronariae]
MPRHHTPEDLQSRSRVARAKTQLVYGDSDLRRVPRRDETRKTQTGLTGDAEDGVGAAPGWIGSETEFELEFETETEPTHAGACARALSASPRQQSRWAALYIQHIAS